MKRFKTYTFSYILVAFFLSSCAIDGTTINNTPSSGLQPNHGYLAVRMNSNKKFKQYLYYDKANKSLMSTLTDRQTRFVYSGNSNLMMTPVLAGRYYWSLFHAGGNVNLQKKETFEVLPGKINYAGDIDILLFPRRSQVRLKVSDKTSEVRQEVQKNSPDLFKKYPLTTSIAKIN